MYTFWPKSRVNCVRRGFFAREDFSVCSWVVEIVELEVIRLDEMVESGVMLVVELDEGKGRLRE